MPDLLLQTPRLRIVPFRRDHISADYIGWLNDRELMRYSNQRFLTHTEESCRRYLESFEGTAHLFMAIERAEDHALIGTMTAYIDSRHERADLGILIGHPDARGKGFGAEAWTAVMQYLFETRAVRKITAGMMAENAAMRRLAERVGMQPDGIRARHNLLEGRAVDVLHFAAFREEWRAKLTIGGTK